MAARLLSRLVCGLGAATRVAAGPTTRLAVSESRPPSTLPALVHMWWRQPTFGPAHDNCSGAFLHTSSAAAVSRSTTTSAAAAPTAPSSGATEHSTSDTAAAVAPPVAGEPGAPAPATLPDPKPDLVDRFLSPEMFSTAARKRRERQAVLRDFQRHPADTGSPQTMVAMWTQRVRELVRNFDSNRKSLHPMRHLEMMVNRRRRMLIWLRRHDFESYSYTITKLGLRDMYTPTGISDRYREGLRHTDPVADDSVNRHRFSFHRKYRQKKTSMWRRLRPKLVAEDPALAAADSATAAASKQHRQQQLAAQAQAVQ